MRKKQLLAGVLAFVIIGASLSMPGNTLQAEAAKKPLQKISVPKKATVYVGAKKKLKVTKAPKSASAKITWKSSNKKVAKVDKKGIVKGLKAGKTTITATVKDKNKKALKAACKVTVKKRLIKSLKTDFSSAVMEVGSTKAVKASIKPGNASVKKLKYTSSDNSIASVSSNGIITAKKEGKATVNVSTKDGSKKSVSIQITVKTKTASEVKVSGILAEETSIKLEVGTPKQINVTVTPENAANKKLNYNTSDPDVATVSESGMIQAHVKGNAEITISAADGSGISTVVNVAVVQESKIRTIVTSDAEADDQNSFMRLMLYANEIDLEGLVFTSSQFHWAGDPETGVEMNSWAGTDWAKGLLDDYAKVYENLKVHADGYPAPNYLQSIVKEGNIKFKGDMTGETEGSRLVKEALLDDDERTLYLQAWGGSNTIAMALKSIQEEYANSSEWNAICEKINRKAFLYLIGEQDETYSEYISKEWPEIRAIVDGTQNKGLDGIFWTFAYPWMANIAGNTREPELTTTFSGDWMFGNIKNGHGPLLANYHLNSSDDGFLSEGDSPAYFYLLDTGLRNLEDPAYGGWNGRFVKDTDNVYRANGCAFDYNPYLRDEAGNIAGGMSSAYTFTRWFDDIQNDFASRADWCVASDYGKANHRPTVSVSEGTDLTAAPGERVTLHAAATDPDGDRISYEWWQYYEADSYSGDSDGKLLPEENSSKHIATITIPKDAKSGDTIHMIVKVRDKRENYMSHYQRVIITVQ
ncbi:MAG: DUF1593 domain-containing protein [Dorea sp.]|nr:DUF1593 domain-containing protein [Dorea sp.]